MNIFALSAATMIPAILLCWYIYIKDREEKEPFLLLASLFIAGAAVYLPAYYLEGVIASLVDGAFSSHMTFSLTGVAQFNSESSEICHGLCQSFVSVALVEELIKWLVLFLITHKNKNFNSLFDGIVYAVFVSIGFAVVENVRYGIVDGWGTFILRAITNVPAQMTFGVIMGCLYTIWHTYLLCKKREKELKKSGVIFVHKPFSSAPFIILSIVIPFILHGVYNFVQNQSSDLMLIIFYSFVFLLYIICFVVVHFMSAADSEDDKTVSKLIRKKYPETVGMDIDSEIQL